MIVPLAKRAAILELIANGASARKAAAQHGVHNTTVDEWLKSADPLSPKPKSKLHPHEAAIRELFNNNPALTAHDVAARYGVSTVNAHRFLKRCKIPYRYVRSANSGTDSYCPPPQRSTRPSIPATQQQIGADA